MRRRPRPVEPGLHPEITLSHASEFTLYHNAFSLCSKKARVCLAELGLAWESRHVELIETGAYETLSPAFLAVNPAGTVPVLLHHGHPVYESHEQIRYAAEHAPPGAPALVPADPGAREEMQRWVARASLTGDDPVADTAASAAACAAGLTIPLFAAMIADVPVPRIVEGLRVHRLKIRPLLFLLLKATGVRRLHRIPPVARVLRTARRGLGRHLDALEAQLARCGGPWICGTAFTLADVSWMAIFERMLEQDALEALVERGRHAAVRAYWGQLRARPSHAIGIAAWRHPTVARGTARLRAAKAAVPRLRALLEGEPPAPPEGRMPAAHGVVP